jgi:hypothetical protein
MVFAMMAISVNVASNTRKRFLATYLIGVNTIEFAK